MSEFKYNIENGVAFYTIEKFDDTGKVKTCFTTRIGGISEGKFASLNAGYKSGDEKARVGENLEILSRSSGFSINDMVISDQVHSSNCRIVDLEDRGKGIIKSSDIIGVDALITNEKGVSLCIFTADCVPVFIYDKKNNAIALCHAGWRGTVNGIVNNAIDLLIKTYNTLPEDIIAALGPSIGPCCFEVNNDVANKFTDVFGQDKDIVLKNKEKYNINLWNALKKQLILLGVKDQNIVSSMLCTSCNDTEFYSYRRDGSLTGRMVSILQLI